MSDTQTKSPSHYAYHVRKGEGDRSYFTKIGAAWLNRDGKGYNVTLDCLPVDGKITLRVPEEKPEQ